MLEPFTQQLAAKISLDAGQIARCVEHLTDEAVAAQLKADFLVALAQKGETPEEIAAFAVALREKSIPPPLEQKVSRAGEILDVVGTGGDQLSTFNISTTAAILCAAAGVTVAKHGNRAVTSSVGSADVIEALGIRVDLSPAEAARCAARNTVSHFFSRRIFIRRSKTSPPRAKTLRRARPADHFQHPRPAAESGAAQRASGRRAAAGTVRADGARAASRSAAGAAWWCADKAEKRKAESGISWMSFPRSARTTSRNFTRSARFSTSVLSPENFPLQPATLADLRGGDKFVNAEIIRRILRGDERGPKRDAVLLNAGAALFVAGKTKSLIEGWELAAETIDSGKAGAKLAELAA